MTWPAGTVGRPLAVRSSDDRVSSAWVVTVTAPGGAVTTVPIVALVDGGWGGAFIPAEAGTHGVRWTGPSGEVIDQTVAVEPAPADTWIPTVADIAPVVHEFTRAPFTSDQQQAGQPHGGFDDTTVPTRTEVEVLITDAVREVRGRVGRSIKPACFALAHSTVATRTAMMVLSRVAPLSGDDTRSALSQATAAYLKLIEQLADQAGQPAYLVVT